MKSFRFFDLLHHTTVNVIRKSDGNAIRGLLTQIIRSSLMVVFFVLMMTVIGMRENAVRGSFILYVMTGVFLYIGHIGAVKAATSNSSTDSMLLHSPVSTILLIASSCIAAVYNNIIAIVCILFVSHVMIEPVYIYNMKGVAFAFFLGWISGFAVGMVFQSLTPFFPRAMPLVVIIYQRATMIFSGKMFLANMLPATMLPMFTWHPLFHAVDQARGHAFINYYPHNTDINYTMWCILWLLILGMMLDYWARRFVSVSWNNRR